MVAVYIFTLFFCFIFPENQWHEWQLTYLPNFKENPVTKTGDTSDCSSIYLFKGKTYNSSSIYLISPHETVDGSPAYLFRFVTIFRHLFYILYHSRPKDITAFWVIYWIQLNYNEIYHNRLETKFHFFIV